MKKTSSIIKKLLEELERAPLIESACARVGISRNTFYRWVRTDPSLGENVAQALFLGTGRFNDVAVGNMLEGIKNKDYRYTMAWLNRKHPDFRQPYVHRTESEDPLEQSRLLKEAEKKHQLERGIKNAENRRSESELMAKRQEVRRIMDGWVENEEQINKRIEAMALAMHKKWIEDNHDPFKGDSNLPN